MYKTIILIHITMLALSACSTTTPDQCPDCEGADDTTAEPITDLPCGGADLQSDDLNCGVCGNECPVEYSGGPFEAGNCNEGQCGPRWFPKSFAAPDPEAPPDITCAQVCAEYQMSCVEQGCSGLTGYRCMTLFGSGCSNYDEYEYPWGFGGSCTETFPWPPLDPGVHLQIGCCCQA